MRDYIKNNDKPEFNGFVIELAEDGLSAKIYGRNKEEAHANAIAFWKMFIGDKWLSLGMAQIGWLWVEGKEWYKELAWMPLNVVIPDNE